MCLAGNNEENSWGKDKLKLFTNKISNFDELRLKILRKRPKAPSSFSTYFTSSGRYQNFGLKEELGIKFWQLKNLFQKISKEKPTPTNIGKFIWTQDHEFEETKKQILLKQPSCPSNCYDYFFSRNEYKDSGLISHTGKGYRRLIKICLESGMIKAHEKLSPKIRELIWGEEKILEFKDIKKIILTKQSARPKNCYKYFTSQEPYKSSGLKAHVGIGIVTLKSLTATDFALSPKELTMLQISDLIW